MFIQVAVNGESFCDSARRAFEIVFQNILRVGAIGVISTFILFIGKVMVTAGTVIVACAIMYNDSSLTFWYIPALVRNTFGRKNVLYFVDCRFIIILHCKRVYCCV
jgi:hypothetical protein